MTQTELFDAIREAFDNLYNHNAHVFDYWISELYDEEDNEVWDKWNEQTLKLMETDVMYAMNTEI